MSVHYRIWVEVSDPGLKKDKNVERGKSHRKRKETSKFICGKGVAKLLRAIKKFKSLTKAAKSVGYSYKYAWDRTQKIKQRLGEPAVESRKGGKGGGGEMHLTPIGEKVLALYEEYDKFILKCIRNKERIEKSGLLD
ncbi:MAG: winged helix-turn-helix domain-containing protein [Promethearchaeota archaeon]